jgi:hypothetical protein
MIILKVPYAEKDEAKALGARWNSARKVWYVPDGQAATPFEKWLGAPQADSAPGAAAGQAKADSGRVDAYVGKASVGKYYVALEHDCNPFVECEVCKPILEKSGWLAAHEASGKMLQALGGR